MSTAHEPFRDATPHSGAHTPPPTQAEFRAEHESLGEMFQSLSAKLSTLVSQEIALAKAEATESAKKAGKGAGLLAGAAVGGFFLLMFLSLALMHLLDVFLPIGWAALIVAVLWGVVAAVLFVFAPQTAAIIAPGFGPEQRELYTNLFRIMLITPVVFAASIALEIARRGGRVELVGSIGDDPSGDAIVVELGRAGIGHAALLRDPGGTTPVTGRLTSQLPRLDAADVDLGLRYVIDFTVLILADPLSPDAESAGRAVSVSSRSTVVGDTPASAAIADMLSTQSASSR